MQKLTRQVTESGSPGRVRALLGRVHGQIVHDRRTSLLASRVAALLPRSACVLDVGTGDGLIAARMLELRKDIRIRGIDVLVRPQTRIPVERFDGRTLPYSDASWDVITLVDVVHHALDPERLLSECGRVARRAVVVKDHLREGFAAGATLRFMDWVGNAPHGVALPYRYYTSEEWRRALSAASLDVDVWDDQLKLYWAPLDLLFGRRLHFIARTRPSR